MQPFLFSFFLPSFYGELVWLVGGATFQARAVHANTSWVAAFGDGNVERTFRNWSTIIANLHTVRT